VEQAKEFMNILQNVWTTCGVVGALMLSITYGSFSADPQPNTNAMQARNVTLVGYPPEYMYTGYYITALLSSFSYFMTVASSTVYLALVSLLPPSNVRERLSYVVWLLMFPGMSIAWGTGAFLVNIHYIGGITHFGNSFLQFISSFFAFSIGGIAILIGMVMLAFQEQIFGLRMNRDSGNGALLEPLTSAHTNDGGASRGVH
jgi:hypothetical protein